MSIRNVRQVGDEILRKKSKKVTTLDDRTKTLIDDMINTMEEQEGCGLAAVQVGVLKDIIVVKELEVTEEDEDGNEKIIKPAKTHVFINPEIVYFSEEKNKDFEGCLSVLGKRAVVERSNEIKLKAKDINMKDIEFSAEGFLARTVQHEVDHLNGILYVDKAKGKIYDEEELQKLEEEAETKSKERIEAESKG